MAPRNQPLLFIAKCSRNNLLRARVLVNFFFQSGDHASVNNHSPDKINASTNWGKVFAAIFLLRMTSERFFKFIFFPFCSNRTHNLEANTITDSGSDGFDIKTNKN